MLERRKSTKPNLRHNLRPNLHEVREEQPSLGKVWEEHTAQEFAHKDVDATMRP